MRVYRAKYLDSQTSIPTHRNTQHLPDNKTPTLAANDVHFEGGVIEPGLDVEPQEASGDWVLQVGDLHRVAIPVPTEQLNSTNTFHPTLSFYSKKLPFVSYYCVL